MNLLLLGKATPRELVVCTFTEKAAFEFRDRIGAAARRVGYTGDLSELQVCTIHGLCNRLLMTYRHRTPLGNDYETLDELTQLLFIFEHFAQIVGPRLRVAICISGRPSGPRLKAYAAILTRSSKNSSIPSSFGTLQTPSCAVLARPTTPIEPYCTARTAWILRISKGWRMTCCLTRTRPQPSRVASSTSWWMNIKTPTVSRNSSS